MKNEKVSRLFLRFNGGGPVGYMPAAPGQLPQYQTGADLNGVDLKTRQDFDHYYGGKYPILAEGGDTDMDGDDQSFYTNKVNTFIKGIQETAQKNLLKEIMREAQGENEEKEYSDEEVIQAAYGMNFNQRPDYGNSLYDPGNLDMFTNAADKTGNLKSAFRDFGMSKLRNPDKFYTKYKTKYDTGFADIFKEKNPVYTYGEMGYGGGLDEYQGSTGSSTTANDTGTGVTQDKNNGFRTQMINGKLYAVGPDGRLFEASEAKKPENKTFQFTNRNKLTPEFAEAMRKGTYLDTRLLGPPVIEEKGFGPFKRNVTTWQYGKLSGDPYATQNTGVNPSMQTKPGTTSTQKTSSEITPPKIDSPAVDAANAWNYRPGQDTDYFPPSGGWQDFPGTMQVDQAGPRDTESNPNDTPFQSQYVPGSTDYPNVPKVPTAAPKPVVTTSSQSNVVPIGTPYPNQDQSTFNRDPNNITVNPYPNHDPSGKPLPTGYVWDAGLNTAVMNSSANTGTNTLKGNTNNKPVNPSATSYTPTAFDMNRTFGQIAKTEDEWFGTKPAGLALPDNYDKDWRNYNVDKTIGSAVYPNANKVKQDWDAVMNKNPQKKALWDSFNDMPAPIKEIAADQLFNAGYDPRVMVLGAAGVDKGYTGKGSAVASNPEYRKWLKENADELWKNNKDLINQQYADDPQAFTSSITDNRKIIYANLRTPNKTSGLLTDFPSNSGGPGTQYNAWSGRSGAVQDYIDQTYFNPTNGYVAPQYFKKEGGTILPIFQGLTGPSTFTDMAEEDEYGPIIDPTTGKPLESKIFGEVTDADKINNLDAGTEYDQRNNPNTFFTENPFNVKQTSKRKKIYDPNRTFRNMGLATAFFSQDERLANKRKLSEFAQASERFNDAPSFYGNDVINTGKRMIGDGSGVPVFNYGYAQMGGSMLDNIKEGDEVYLTEEQINDIIKRGGKLSYL